ncbi:AAA family ATPase [Streptomyces sp. I8-5]|uniref:AAA family ATPase n=1 Tax=Streptomyces sp. I8-5 TaxID=3104277 RepID=UPI0038691F1F
MADAMEREDERRPVRRTLTDELNLPDDEQLYSIDRLLPHGGNALFAGRYKAGKTTFNGQLLKAWADREPFLGEFDVYPDPEHPVVTIFNYEMSEGQFRRWLRRVGIRNTAHVHVVHLRGLSLPLSLPHIREEVAEWLREANTGLWIVDPASRALAGVGDGNDNTDVARFVGWLDEIKLMAGVRDLVLNIHMGHAAAADKDAERAIGAQAWSAWADALWFLNKDKDNCRWFSADGRDVSVEKMLVSYQAEDMSVALVDVDPETQKRDMLDRKVIECITHNPGIGATRIRNEIGGNSTEVGHVLDRLIREGVIATRPGARRKVEHYLSEDAPILTRGMGGDVQDSNSPSAEDHTD